MTQRPTSRFRSTFVLAVVAISLVGCTESPQDQAREKLVGEMGVIWSQEKFLEAAKNGNDMIAGLFLEGGMDSEVEDAEGRTALILATEEGHASTVTMLLDKGADGNNTDNDGKTALILAVEQDQPGVLLALLAKGVDVNAKAADGTTALSAAQQRGQTETVKLLESHGAT